MCVILTSCQPTQPPEFRRIQNFSVKSISLAEAKIGFSITMFNPNNFGLTVKEAVADVSVDSLQMGQFTQDQDVAVSKKSEFTVALSGSIPLAQALKFNLKDLSNREVLIRALGSAKLQKAGITVSKPFEYSGKHRLDEIKLFK